MAVSSSTTPSPPAAGVALTPTLTLTLPLTLTPTLTPTPTPTLTLTLTLTLPLRLLQGLLRRLDLRRGASQDGPRHQHQHLRARRGRLEARRRPPQPYDDAELPHPLGGAPAGSKCHHLGSAPARLLCLLRSPVAAPGSSALPGRGRPTGIPTTASGARASRLQRRRCHRL